MSLTIQPDQFVAQELESHWSSANSCIMQLQQEVSHN